MFKRGFSGLLFNFIIALEKINKYSYSYQRSTFEHARQWLYLNLKCGSWIWILNLRWACHLPSLLLKLLRKIFSWSILNAFTCINAPITVLPLSFFSFFYHYLFLCSNKFIFKSQSNLASSCLHSSNYQLLKVRRTQQPVIPLLCAKRPSTETQSLPVPFQA